MPFNPITPKVAPNTISPAAAAPKAIKITALPKSTPNTKAAAQALQIPVMGNGIAVKMKSANEPQTSNFNVCFFRVLSKSQVKKRLT